MNDSDLTTVEQRQRWPAGKVLFQEGDEPRGIYVIHSGEVELIFSSRNGVSKALRKMGQPEIIGLSDALAGVNHNCTATTRTAAQIGFIPIADLRGLLDAKPSVWFSIVRMLSMDVNSCVASMRTLTAR